MDAAHLLASWDGQRLLLARQQPGGRRGALREVAAGDARALQAMLAAALEEGPQRLRQAALVAPDPERLAGLRGVLQLHTLVLHRRDALRDPGLAGAAWALARHAREQACPTPERLLDFLREQAPRLPPSERRVAALLLADPQAVLRTPTARLAREAGISQPQVIRFCRSLGFEGVSELRRALGACLALQARGAATTADELPLLARAAEVVQQAQALLDQLRSELERARAERHASPPGVHPQRC